MTRKTPSNGRVCARAEKPRRNWRKCFLAELAATSNVAASARKAKINPSTAYDARRNDAEFYRAWQEALCEGYEHLEMTLLHRLREGEIKPASGAKRGTRTFDNATALRLLSLHRDSVSRERAVRDARNSGAILESINQKLDRMRERALAAKANADA